jgi:transposase-like protein
MQRHVYNGVSYSHKYYNYVVLQVVREGHSATKVSYEEGINDVAMVRTWVREYMNKRGLKRAPRRLKRRAGAPPVNIPACVDVELRRLEETVYYLETLLENAYLVMDNDQKKSLLRQLSPKLRQHLKDKEKP